MPLPISCNAELLTPAERTELGYQQYITAKDKNTAQAARKMVQESYMDNFAIGYFYMGMILLQEGDCKKEDSPGHQLIQWAAEKDTEAAYTHALILRSRNQSTETEEEKYLHKSYQMGHVAATMVLAKGILDNRYKKPEWIGHKLSNEDSALYLFTEVQSMQTKGRTDNMLKNVALGQIQSLIGDKVKTIRQSRGYLPGAIVLRNGAQVQSRTAVNAIAALPR
ncbi:MAG: hypothetical protein EOM37_01605 [Proteobacteria bacterium]|jgi:hypothetical protein|nr:hypothetical protein [Alphaproteobacteria bacterium]NCC02733.1 hypothetical protein [Pseudomonadota bacterium]